MSFSINAWNMIERTLACPDVRTAYLHGPPGAGKTWVAYHRGRVEQGFYAITLTDETSAAELRGHFIFRGGDAEWHDGPFIRAMREGKRLVINEITNASADVLALLNPVLEGEDTAMLTLPSGETVKPALGFHVIATDNRKPDLLPECLKDRFDVEVEVQDTNPEAFNMLSPELKKVAEQKIGDGDRRISARGWMALDKLRGEFGLHDACRLVFGLERGRLVHDALVIALADKPEEPEVNVEVEEPEVRRIAPVTTASEFTEQRPGEDTAMLTLPSEFTEQRPNDYTYGCGCTPCRKYAELLDENGYDPETEELR